MKHFKEIIGINESVFIKTNCHLLFLFFMSFSFGQDNEQAIIKDTLANKSYKELNKLSNHAFENSYEQLLNLYRGYHLNKAKKEINNLEIARAYYFFISWENMEKDIKYCDSIVNITQNSTHRAYPTQGYLIKAILYYNNSEYSNALDNYITANEWAKIKKYKPLQMDALLGIANIKNVWGLHDEALEIYRTYYTEIINSPDYIVEQYDDYMLMFHNLSLSYIRNHKPDSALMIAKLGMKPFGRLGPRFL